jgi:hypothetical protein
LGSSKTRWPRKKATDFAAGNPAAKGLRDRVRDGFLKKKTGIEQYSDGELDKAVIGICEKMKADRDKSRVTFYYLLAEKYEKVSMLG